MAAKQQESNGSFKTMIGGQALIEGIMMRGVDKQSIVVRTDSGMVTRVDELHPAKEKHPWLGWPLIRGVVNFFDALVNGMKALTYSASQAPEEMQEEPSKLDLWVEKHFGMEKAEKFSIGFAVVLGVCLALGLFIFLPTLLVGFLGIADRDVLRSLLEGLVKLVIFFGYLYGCSRAKSIRRVFSYHGAEHKTIFCYEHGKELTVENVRPESRFHPRCGTSFLFVVIFLSIIVFIFVNAFLGISNTFLRMLLKLLLLPLVVALSYELNRWAGRHDELWLSHVLTWPGRQLQRLTTNEPDDSMIEVAITALKLVIPEKKGADAW